ncbi:MAG TPA: efflux RND transporter permease subunit [Candidatus Krumholzibacteria bacterium]|nr:efflux RND transporter permease subunit [Candidatus Krumholzibacteria bacterium]HPD72294.1 efflux RND transporter permease subunit [Candidatus Krumholzibacteria bacterium]HRY40774.1 efflux RND transporter permease subunit [Candidatus Krumholzibacteria bacterium]
MIRFFVDHPVTTWMVFTALLVCGVYAVPRLNIEAMPETDLPKLTVHTRWNGGSPSAIQRAITLPVEEAAAQCRGIEKIESASRHGQSTVEISYQRGIDIEFARLELNEQLGNVRRNLPAQASQPVVVPEIPEEMQAQEFFTVNLISPLPVNELREEAEDWLKPRFLAIPGVAEAQLQGGALPLLKVNLSLEKMDRYGLTADFIYSRLDARDDIVPSGAIRRRGQELTVTVQDSVTVTLLADTVLKNVGGQPILLSHVAEIERGFEDVNYFRRTNGQNVITLRITKRSGENSVGVSRRLRAAIPVIQAEMPFPVALEIDQDEGEELQEKLTELVWRSVFILALLFVLLSIALRRVELVGIVLGSILFAIVICLSLFYFFDYSVNFITISGLTICFGMLLDNSILVLDSVHRHLTVRRRGDARAALVRGTGEVAFPIVATTVTTVIAFLSFIYLTGRLALTYTPLAVSVTFATVASVFVAFCWMPVALRRTAEREASLAGGAPTARSGWRLVAAWSAVSVIAGAVFAVAVLAVKNQRALQDLAPWIGATVGLLILIGIFVAFVERLTWLHLRFWPYPVAVMLLLFAGSWWAFEHRVEKGGWWQPSNEEELILYLSRPLGTDVQLASETMKLFESELLPLPPDVTMSTQAWANNAFMRVEFTTEAVLYSAYPELFRNRLILLAEELGGMFIYIGGFGDPYLKGGRGGINSNSTILLSGYNSKDLKRLSDGIVARLERNRRARNVRLSSGASFEQAGVDETVILVDREALAQHRLSMVEVLGHLRRLLGVDTPWNMTIEGENKQIQLNFAEASTIQYDAVLAKTFTTSRGERIGLGELIRLETRPELSAITRTDQRYAQRINWEYIGTDRMRQAYIRELLDGLDLPYGFTAEDLSGQQISEEEVEELGRTLWLTVLFIYMSMAALMECFALSALMLLAVPMALVGVVGVFWGAGASFDSSAQIGLVLMFGVVVNNAVLLVNRFRLMVREIVADRSLAGRGVPAKARLGGIDLWRLEPAERRAILAQAVVEGTSIQLRSILLATGTTVAGLLPLLYQVEKVGNQGGKDIWENLALATIGGVTSSTILILMVMPALYWVFTRLGWSLIRLRHRGARRSAPAGGALEPPPAG